MPKKLLKPGKLTSPKVEVQNISQEGLWIWVVNQEFFLPFVEFPWFKKATIDQIYNIQFFHGKHLHWPTLDIDIELDSLKHLESYPLIYS